MTRLALIGVGRWGKNIERTLREDIGSVELLTATTPAQAKKLLREELDGVLVATPGSTHAKVALPFIEKSLPTFVEKPLATSLRDATRIEKAAKKSGVPIMVGHIHLYNPAYQKAKQLLGKAGKIHALYFEGMNWGPVRDDMSALWDWSPHDVAMAVDLLDTMPTSVQAWGQNALRPRTKLYDMVQLKLTFPKGVTAHISNGWLSPEKKKKMTVVAQKQTITYDDVAPDKKVAVHTGKPPQPAKISHPAYGKRSPLEAELRVFLSMVKTGKEPATGLTHAMDVMRVLVAAERSLEQDGKIIRP